MFNLFDVSNLRAIIQTRWRFFMIIQSCDVLQIIISKIESMITEQKTKCPNLSDEEIFEQIKMSLRLENISKNS